MLGYVPSSAKSATANVTALAAGTDGHVLRRSGTDLAFGELGANTVGSTQISDGAVTQAKRSTLSYQISSSNGFSATASSTYSDITNLSVTITTTGRPVFVGMIPDGNTSSECTIGVFAGSGGTFAVGFMNFLRDGTIIAINRYSLGNLTGLASGFSRQDPCSSHWFIDVGASAGSRTYKAQFRLTSGASLSVQNAKLVAYEL
jgi:hypothetical protein